MNKKSLYSMELNVIEMAEKLTAPSNNYIIEITEKSYQDNILFINELRSYNIGFIDYIDENSIKPIQIHPISVVQNSIELNKDGYPDRIRRKITKHLSEISIYLDSKPNKVGIIDLHKQFLSPIQNNEEKEINLIDIIRVLDSTRNSSMHKINIISSDIFNYSNFLSLIEFLEKFPANKFYYLLLSDFIYDNDKILQLNNSNNYFILSLFHSEDHKKLKKVFDLCHKNNIHLHTRFLVSDEKQVKYFENIIQKYEISDYSYIPFYNGSNLQFFKKNVFMTFNEVLATEQDIQDLHLKEYINPYFFGKLAILPDGFISYDFQYLIHIEDDFSINEVLFKAMTGNSRWRLTRKNVEPCNSCVAKFICPPISSYETVLHNYKICDK